MFSAPDELRVSSRLNSSGTRGPIRWAVSPSHLPTLLTSGIPLRKGDGADAAEHEKHCPDENERQRRLEIPDLRSSRGDYGSEFCRSPDERDREITRVGRSDGPLGNLTERQRESLEAAYRSGYFDWPRESTAAEVADSLGIDRSTFHAHLRKAEQCLFSTLIDPD